MHAKASRMYSFTIKEIQDIDYLLPLGFSAVHLGPGLLKSISLRNAVGTVCAGAGAGTGVGAGAGAGTACPRSMLVLGGVTAYAGEFVGDEIGNSVFPLSVCIIGPVGLICAGFAMVYGRINRRFINVMRPDGTIPIMYCR